MKRKEKGGSEFLYLELVIEDRFKSVWVFNALDIGMYFFRIWNICGHLLAVIYVGCQ